VTSGGFVSALAAARPQERHRASLTQRHNAQSEAAACPCHRLFPRFSTGFVLLELRGLKPTVCPAALAAQTRLCSTRVPLRARGKGSPPQSHRRDLSHARANTRAPWWQTPGAEWRSQLARPCFPRAGQEPPERASWFWDPPARCNQTGARNRSAELLHVLSTKGKHSFWMFSYQTRPRMDQTQPSGQLTLEFLITTALAAPLTTQPPSCQSKMGFFSSRSPPRSSTLLLRDGNSSSGQKKHLSAAASESQTTVTATRSPQLNWERAAAAPRAAARRRPEHPGRGAGTAKAPALLLLCEPRRYGGRAAVSAAPPAGRPLPQRSFAPETWKTRCPAQRGRPPRRDLGSPAANAFSLWGIYALPNKAREWRKTLCKALWTDHCVLLCAARWLEKQTPAPGKSPAQLWDPQQRNTPRSWDVLPDNRRETRRRRTQSAALTPGAATRRSCTRAPGEETTTDDNARGKQVCKFNVNSSRGLKPVWKLTQSSEARLTPSPAHFSTRESRRWLPRTASSARQGQRAARPRPNASPGIYVTCSEVISTRGTESKNTSPSRTPPAANP